MATTREQFFALLKKIEAKIGQDRVAIIHKQIKATFNDTNLLASLSGIATTLSSILTKNTEIDTAQDLTNTKLDTVIAKDFSTETTLEAARVLLASLDGKDFATQTTLASLEGKDFATQSTLNTRASQATLENTNTLLNAIDSDGDATRIATQASAVDLAALEVLVTAGNVDLAAIEALLITIDADTSSPRSTQTAMQALIVKIEPDTDAIRVAQQASQVDLAAIEVLITATNVGIADLETQIVALGGILTTIDTAQDLTNTRLSTIITHVDGIEGKLDVMNGHLALIEQLNSKPNNFVWSRTYTCTAAGTLTLQFVLTNGESFWDFLVGVNPDVLAGGLAMTIRAVHNQGPEIQFEIVNLSTSLRTQYPLNSATQLNVDQMSDMLYGDEWDFHIEFAALAEDDVIDVSMICKMRSSTLIATPTVGGGGTFTTGTEVRQVDTL